MVRNLKDRDYGREWAESVTGKSDLTNEEVTRFILRGGLFAYAKITELSLEDDLAFSRLCDRWLRKKKIPYTRENREKFESMIERYKERKKNG